MDRVIAVVIGVVLALGLSAIVFIGINKLFDLSEKRFAIFNAVIGGVSGFVVFALLWGNQMIVSPEIVTLMATLIGAATGFALGLVKTRSGRLAVGVAGGLTLGLVAGSATRSIAWPSIDPVAVVVGVALGAGFGALHWVITRRRHSARVLILAWLSVGWLFGAWLAADLDGSKAEVVFVAAVLGLLVGAWIGSVPYPDRLTRASIATGSRKYIFLAPAMFFIAATLLVPLGRTIWLGFLTGTPTKLEFSGLENYVSIFTDSGIIDVSDWTSIFTGRLFWSAVLLVVVGVGLGRWLGRSGGTGLGTGFSLSAGTGMLIGVGVILGGFAFFTVIRGTIPNNLWWIFSVTVFSVGLGLAIAVLADRSKGENAAKSLIFLPLAISFVGASIIWRGPMYTARPPSQDQTGVFNAIWVQVGEWSTSDTSSLVISLGLLVIVAFAGYIGLRGWQSGNNAILAGSVAINLALVWLVYRFLGPGIGGVIPDPITGEPIPDPVIFLTSNPWNNFWMMLVFIWIQTGFAMVIFSAAIKAVPDDLLEAARIDGATESQTFWKVTVPQIFPTIGVVATTLIVTVLKVFDIPKVMTNGNFDTQVLANEMWQRAFTELNFGLGSALAVVIFLGVLPIMYLNIRRMQRERLG